MGDFNDLLSNDEKIGATDYPLWCIRRFREVVIDSHLIDVSLEGSSLHG